MYPCVEPAPEFKEKMIKGYQNCYRAAYSMPEDVLAEMGPKFKMMGHQKLFFKCEKVNFI